MQFGHDSPRAPGVHTHESAAHDKVQRQPLGLVPPLKARHWHREAMKAAESSLFFWMACLSGFAWTWGQAVARPAVQPGR